MPAQSTPFFKSCRVCGELSDMGLVFNELSCQPFVCSRCVFEKLTGERREFGEGWLKDRNPFRELPILLDHSYVPCSDPTHSIQHCERKDYFGHQCGVAQGDTRYRHQNDV